MKGSEVWILSARSPVQAVSTAVEAAVLMRGGADRGAVVSCLRTSESLILGSGLLLRSGDELLSGDIHCHRAVQNRPVVGLNC